MGTRVGRKLAGALAEALFGSEDDRRGRHPEIGSPEFNAQKPEDRANQEKFKKFKERIAAQKVAGSAAEVAIPGDDGRLLQGNFFNANGDVITGGTPNLAQPVVLYLSGSGGTAEEQATDVAEFYQSSGASVLSANYGGYGGSTAMMPTEKTLLEDAQSMLEHLLDLGYPPDKIIIHGYSMGGAIAGVLYAHNKKEGVEVRGLVLDRPMLNTTAGVMGQADLPKPLTKLGAAPTRGLVGKLPAKEALMQGGVSSPTVITSDEVTKTKKKGKDTVADSDDFAFGAERFRDQLRAQTTKTVSGAQSGKNHFDNQAMIKQNKDALRELVNKTRDELADTDFTVNDPDDVNNKTLSELERKIDSKVQDVQATSINLTNCGQTARIKLGQPPFSDANKRKQCLDYLDECEKKVAEIRTTCTEFLNLPTPPLSTDARNKIGSINANIKTVTAQIARTRVLLGTQTNFSPAEIDAVLTEIGPFVPVITKYKADDATQKAMTEARFLKDYWPLVDAIKKTQTTISPPDKTILDQFDNFKAMLDQKQQQAAQASTTPIIPPPTGSSSGLTASVSSVGQTWRSSSTRGQRRDSASSLLGSRRGSVSPDHV